jgi:hypothetical protein
MAPKVQAFFGASTFTVISNGRHTLFWEDRWIQSVAAIDIAPCFYLHVPSRTRRRQSVREGLTNRAWAQSIAGGISVQALYEYLILWDAVDNVHLSEQPDKMVWRWTPDGNYTAKPAYKMMHAASIPLPECKLIWKAWALLRVKIFLWLAFKRMHRTGDRRARHGLEAREMCYLCDQARETIDHILAACPYTKDLWYNILMFLGKQLPAASHTMIGWWRRLRAGFDGDQRLGLDTLFALSLGRCGRSATPGAFGSHQPPRTCFSES